MTMTMRDTHGIVSGGLHPNILGFIKSQFSSKKTSNRISNAGEKRDLDVMRICDGS